MDISIRIGGEAGQGIQSISSIIAKTFVRQQYNVFINQDFASRIRGGHNFDQVRISNDPVRAVNEKVHILIALDEETTRLDIECLAEGGVLLFDGEAIDFTSDNPRHFSIPFGRIASQIAKSKIIINSVAILPSQNGEFSPCPTVMTEEELICFLRIPEISRSRNHRNVIENLKRRYGLPRIHLCGKTVYLTDSVKAWLENHITYCQ